MPQSIGCPSRLSCLVLAALLSAAPAFAAWPHDPALNGAPLCVAPGIQGPAQMVQDGAGGTIAVWQDQRGADADVYAQRLDASGVPLWTPNGVAVCSAAGAQINPRLVSDGAGGAIVTWQDPRAGNADVYAQHVQSSGVMDPAWPTDGLALGSGAGDQYAPMIDTDGAGGAIVTWWDTRSGNSDIYAGRVDGAGNALWGANGTPVCTGANLSDSPVIVSDGSGGAIIAWEDNRSNVIDIYAQRLDANGTALWMPNGIPVCLAPFVQSLPAIVSDGAGGAIVAWYDLRLAGGAASPTLIYAQRLLPSGAPFWTANGIAISALAGDKTKRLMVGDGAGGAFFEWLEILGAQQPVLQHITNVGSAAWGSNGTLAITGGFLYPDFAALVPDGVGGAICGWTTARANVASGQRYAYAQRFNAAGAPQWPVGDVLLSGTFVGKQGLMAVPDGAGGAVFSWMDQTLTGDYDLYAGRIEHYGALGSPEPAITGVKDVLNDQGGAVRVAWNASYLDADPLFGINDYRLWRSVPVAALSARALLVRGITSDPDAAAAGGGLLAGTQLGAGYAWEVVTTQAADGLPSYSLVAATLGDSLGASNPPTVFMIEARKSATLGSAHWFSSPDSGYSVDNLAPATPAAFTGQFVAGTVNLFWRANTEPDLAGYRLYASRLASFTPDPSNLLSASPNTWYGAAASAGYTYKLTAVDTHGNESRASQLQPGGTAGAVDAPGVGALELEAPSPNPARAGTLLRYALPRATGTRLAIYDAAGRVVRVLADGEAPAGRHEAAWDLRDQAGRELGAGLYFARLEAGGRVVVRRLMLLR